MKCMLFTSLLALLLLVGCNAPAAGSSGNSNPAPPVSSPTSSESTSEICLAPTLVRAYYERGYANMDIYLPEDWCFEVKDPTEDSTSFGIHFWPEDDPKFEARLLFYPDLFAICGTGVTYEELQFQNGQKATLCWERMQSGDFWAVIFFSDLPGSYALQLDTTYQLWETYKDELLGIIGTSVLADDIISMTDALNIAVSEHIHDVDPASLTATFDYTDGTWGIENSEYFLLLSSHGELLEMHKDPE